MIVVTVCQATPPTSTTTTCESAFKTSLSFPLGGNISVQVRDNECASRFMFPDPLHETNVQEC